MSESLDAEQSFDIDSTYRNRNEYPNPYDFVVPYSFPNKGSTSLGFIDPILDSSPYSGSSYTPGTLFTGGTLFANRLGGQLGDASTTTSIILDSRDTTIDNYYVGGVLQIFSEFRTVIGYVGSTKVCTVSEPFADAPLPGTLYYNRRIPIFFNSNVAIYHIDPLTNSVDKLNLLTAAPSPIRDFYKGSYIRFSNALHVGETTLITAYDPFGAVQSWTQSVALGANAIVPNDTPGGIGFIPTRSGIFNQIVVNMSVFNSTGANRMLRLSILAGSGLSGQVLFTQTVTASTSSTPIDYTFIVNNGCILTSGVAYTLTMLDSTPNAASNGYINVFGVSSRKTLPVYNLSAFPRITIDSSSIIQSWSQPTTLGSSAPLSTMLEYGYQFVPTSTNSINDIVINLLAFDKTGSRSVQLVIRNGGGTSGTVLYTSAYTIPNMTQSDYTFIINSRVIFVTGNTYTLTLLDKGSQSTGFFSVYGIVSDSVNYVAYNTTTYPRLNIFNLGYSQYGPEMNESTIPFFFGVAISSDATTIATVGFKNTGIYIYTQINTVWTQQGPPLMTTGGVPSQLSANGGGALSSNGNTLVVSDDSDNNGIGAFWVFKRVNSVWSQQGSKLVGGGNIGSSLQGYSISISGDGNTIAAGGPGDSNSIGAIWIFTNINNVYTQYRSKIVATGRIGPSQQGTSISISNDGNTIAVGAVGDNGGTGAVWIFNYVGGNWNQTTKLVANTPSQGNSVSLSSNGTTLAVGASHYNNDIGITIIFVLNQGLWSQQSLLTGTDYIGSAGQGYSVSISSDGNTVSTGGRNDNNMVGAVWIYKRTGTIWSQVGLKLIGSAVNAKSQASFLSISGDGLTVVSDGGNDGRGVGASFYIFKFQPSEIYNQLQNPTVSTILATNTESGFRFIPSQTGTLQSITVNLTAAEYNVGGRSVQINVRDGSGTGGTILYTQTVVIPSTLSRSDYTITPSITPQFTANSQYTLTLTDTTVGGSGSVYIYGIVPNSTYAAYNTVTPTYPRLIINTGVPVVAYSQTLSSTVTDNISTLSQSGIGFVPVFSGFLSDFKLSLTAFDPSGYRTIKFTIYNGSGFAGGVVDTFTIKIATTTNSALASRTDYDIVSGSLVSLTLNSKYTLGFIDVSPSGSGGGIVSLYGITPIVPYNSYNLAVYPRIITLVPSYIITITPPKIITRFAASNFSLAALATPIIDNIEFNSVAHENASTLYYSGLMTSRTADYLIDLKYIVLPNTLLGTSYGGRLDSYPYIYIQIYNEGNRGVINTLCSNNPHASGAIFKCAITKDLYGRCTNYFTLTGDKPQVVRFRPDQNIHITITLPDGTIIMNATPDNMSPLYPNAFLQNNLLFTISPVN